MSESLARCFSPRPKSELPRSFKKMHRPGPHPAPAPVMYSQFLWGESHVSACLKSLLRAPPTGQPRVSPEPFLPDEGAEALRCPDLAHFEHGSPRGGRRSCAPAHSLPLPLPPAASRVCLTPNIKNHCLKLTASALLIGILASLQSKLYMRHGHPHICHERLQPHEGVLNSPAMLVLGSQSPREYEVGVSVYRAFPEQSP